VLRYGNERLLRLQALFDGLVEAQACCGRRLDVAEAQLEHLAEVYQNFRQPPAVDTCTTSEAKASRGAEPGAWELRGAQPLGEEQEPCRAQARASGSRPQQVPDEAPEASARSLRLHGGWRAEEKPVDRRITALEEKLAARGRRPPPALAVPKPATREGHQEDLPREPTAGALDANAPASRDGGELSSTAIALHDLRAEVSEVANQVAAHSKMLEDVQCRLLATQGQGVGAAAPEGEGQDLGTGHACDGPGIAAEVRMLRECVAAGEAAVHSLAPRLLAAARAGDARLALAAHGLECACLETRGSTGGKEEKATRPARGLRIFGDSCWQWWG